MKLENQISSVCLKYSVAVVTQEERTNIPKFPRGKVNAVNQWRLKTSITSIKTNLIICRVKIIFFLNI